MEFIFGVYTFKSEKEEKYIYPNLKKLYFIFEYPIRYLKIVIKSRITYFKMNGFLVIRKVEKSTDTYR